MSRTHDEVEVNVQLQDGMEPQVQWYAREKVTAVLGHTARRSCSPGSAWTAPPTRPRSTR